MNYFSKVPALAVCATALLATTFDRAAHAATPRENAGVLSGAVVGAAAGGPVGMVAGMIGGALYAHRGERVHAGEQLSAELNAQLDAVNARLSASTLALQQVEQTLALRNARVAEQEARIASLAEDQLLLSALELRVRFATDAANVAEDDHETLAILGRYLERHPELRVRVEGHADGRGSDAHNLALSRDRAAAVGSVLAGANVAERQIEMTAHGERAAVAAPEDHAALAQERRVDVRLLPAAQTAPRTAALD